MCHIVLVAGMIVTASVEQDSRQFTRLSVVRKTLHSGDVREKFKAVSQIQDMGVFAAETIPDLLKALSTDDLALKHEIVIALGKMGPAAKAAVPKLISLLDEPSLILKHSSILALGDIGSQSKGAIPKLTEFLDDKNAFIRIPAASALIRIDPENDSVNGKLITILANALGNPVEDLRSDAVHALASMGKPVVAALTNRFLHTDSVQCWHVCDVLTMIGPDADIAVPALVKIVNRHNDKICTHALRALGAIGTRPEIVVPELKKFLSHKSPSVRANAALALGKYGGSASSAVNAISRNLNDADESVRIASIRALGMIGPDAKDAVAQLVATLDDDVGTITLSAAESLGRIGVPAVEPVSKLLTNPKFATLAAGILGEIGSEARSAVPALVTALDSKDEDVRRESILALADIDSDSKEVTTALMKIAHQDTGKERSTAVYALTKIGAEEIVPLLKKSINDPDDELLRLISTWALMQFDPLNEEYIKLAIPQLKTALKHESPFVRKEAATTISRLGIRAKSTVPQLMSLIDDTDPAIRAEAISALGEIGELTPDRIIALAKNLKDPIPDVRHATCYALGKMGVRSRHTIPALKSLLKPGESFENFVVYWTLIRIDPVKATHQKAIPTMIRAMKVSHSTARVQAIESLGLIGSSRPEILMALRNAAEDPEKSVSDAARKVIRKLED